MTNMTNTPRMSYFFPHIAEQLHPSSQSRSYVDSVVGEVQGSYQNTHRGRHFTPSSPRPIPGASQRGPWAQGGYVPHRRDPYQESFTLPRPLAFGAEDTKRLYKTTPRQRESSRKWNGKKLTLTRRCEALEEEFRMLRDRVDELSEFCGKANAIWQLD